MECANHWSVSSGTAARAPLKEATQMSNNVYRCFIFLFVFQDYLYKRMKYKGVVYDVSKPPPSDHYRLTSEQLRALSALLVGKPIRIEHKDQTVGHVKSAQFDNNVLSVDWDLLDDHVGWAAEHLIDSGKSPELSLKHVQYSNGVVEPIEVSLVQVGARDGCVISKENYNTPKENTIHAVEVMASAAAATPVAEAAPASPVPASPSAAAAVAAEVVAPTPVAVPVVPAPIAAEPAVATEEPAAKRAKVEDPVKFLENLQTRISDTDTLQSIADYIALQLEANVNKTNEIAALSEAKRLLEQAQKAHVDSSKNVVKDIVETLSNLYQQYATSNLNDTHKEKLTSLLTADPVAMDALRPLVVAASGISMRAGAQLAVASSKVLDGAFSRLQTLQKQLDSARSMSGVAAAAPASPVAVAPVSAVAPNWTPAVAPTVEVAASAGAMPQGPVFKLPDIFKVAGLQSYNASGGGVGRVLPRDLRNK